MQRTQARRRAVEDTWVQNDRKAADDVRLDTELFGQRPWWYSRGEAHRAMVVLRDSKLTYIFIVMISFLFIYFVTLLIRIGYNR
jgi:hypothetical protein